MTCCFCPEYVYHLQGGLRGVSLIVEQVEVLLNTQGWDDTKIYHVTLVLDELLTNTVSYGYPPPADPQDMQVVVELGFDHDVLHIALKDNGIPFNPLTLHDPHLDASVDDRPIGGLGIYLTHTFMDHISYERQGNTNVLRLESHMKRKV